MATAAIEAKSLSSLTSLASDPPLNPHVNLPRHEQLVLYIARVPGSKDVFLTPLKPRQKVVTAEDVESSLYYLHIHGPEDELLVAGGDGVEGVTTNPMTSYSVANSNFQGEEAPPPLPRRPEFGQGERQPRPLPPLPSRPGYHDQLSAHTASHVHRKPIPTKFQSEYNDLSSTLPLCPQPTNTLASRQPTSSENHTRLTLIRRNPATGEQWNAANISDPPVYDVLSNQQRNSPPHRARRTGQPLYIDVTTPGYSKFLQASSSPYMSSSSSGSSSLTSSIASEMRYEGVFTRRLWMEGSIFENGPSGHKHAISSSHLDLSSLSPRPSFDIRSHSESSFSGNSTTLKQDPVMHTISVDGDQKRSRNKGYTFMSPWNGRCEFSSGIGNSLKCRHRLPANSSLAGQQAPSLASELRFNLPGGGPLASTPSSKTSSSESFRKSRLGKALRHGRSDSSDSVPEVQVQGYSGSTENEQAIDLSLGQELAGGGFAGRQAKLGKLIVEYEGLKMLDLLVAANMSLWWRAYEKAL